MATNVGAVCGALKRFSRPHASNWVWKKKVFCCKMSTESPSLTHTITLPNKPNEPVHIVAAPGVSHSDFWSSFIFPLFLLLNFECERNVDIIKYDLVPLF